jgi:hypothetical protein
MQRLFVECAVRAVLIALGTAAVLGLLRVKSAGARHAAWSGVVALMLLLPAWMAWGPRASLRILPAAPVPVAAVPILLSTPLPLAGVHSAAPAVALEAAPAGAPAVGLPAAPAGAPAVAPAAPAARPAVAPEATTAGAPAVAPDAIPAVAPAAPTAPEASPAVAPKAPPAPWNWPAAVYLSGVFILLARLVLGTLRAHALVRRATRCGGRLTSPLCAAPVTVGWLRPSVILPEYWRSWPQAQLDAVLTHEGEHVRRRDPLVQWLALLNRAIFWFHPLAWWLERRLSALAEEACDAAVLERGHDPHDYSGYLLDLARSVGRMGARIDVVGMAMPGSALPQRIRQILARGPAPRLTRGRAVCLAAACAILSAVFAAASVDRQRSVPDPPPPPAPAAAQAPASSTPSALAAALAPAAAQAPASSTPSVLAAALAPAAVQAPASSTPSVLAAAQAPASSTPSALAAAPAPAAAHAPAPAATPAPAPPATPQPPAPQEYPGKRLIVLYFDLYGTSQAIDAGTNYIQTQLQPADLVAIITSGDEVRVVEDFTADRDKLIDDIQRLTFTSVETVEIGRIVDGLSTALKMLSPIVDRKMLVCFMPFRQADGSEQIQLFLPAAQRGKVRFSGIDLLTPHAIPAGDPAAIDDTVTISVMGWPLNRSLTVGPDWTIPVLLVGNVKAVGLISGHVLLVNRYRLWAQIKKPDVTVNVVTVQVQKRDK